MNSSIDFDERIRKLKDFLKRVFSEYEDKNLYIYVRFYYRNRTSPLNKWFEIESEYRKAIEFIENKLESQLKKEDPYQIGFLYNPTEENSTIAKFVRYIPIDVDSEKSEELEKKIKELKPFAIIDSGNHYHVIFKLDKDVDLEKGKKYAKILVLLLKNKIPEIKIDKHYDPNNEFRLPYSLNLKDKENPKLVNVLEVNEDNIIKVEDLEKINTDELKENVKSIIIENKLEKLENSIKVGRELNSLDLNEKVKTKIKDLINKSNLIRQGFSHEPLLLISSLLIKAGYKFDQVRDFIYELASEFRTKDPPERRVKDTVDHLVNQINALYQKDVEDLKKELVNKINEKFGKEKSELFTSKIESIDDKNRLIRLYVKLSFPGFNFIKELYQLGKIDDETYKTLIKLYGELIKSPNLLKNGKYPLNLEGTKNIVYSNGLIYIETIKKNNETSTKLIHNKHIRFYLLDAKEVKLKDEIRQIVKLKVYNVKTKRYEIVEDDIRYIGEKLSKYIIDEDKNKEYIKFLLREARFKKERGLERIGIYFDDNKGKFIPTYFGYEKYSNVKYFLTEQQRELLKGRYYDVEETISKLKSKVSLEEYYKALDLLRQYYDSIRSEDPYYYYNNVILHGYILGSIVLSSVKRYLALTIPNLILFDNGMGGTGKTTSLKILGKVLFGFSSFDTIELLRSLPQLRLLSSALGIPIIVDDIYKEALLKEKDVLTFLRQLSSGEAISQRLIGTKTIEMFKLSNNFIFSINADIRQELPDVATSDRFLMVEYKTRYVESAKEKIREIKNKIDKIMLELLGNRNITIAHLLYDHLSSILNEYELEGIKDRLSYYADNFIQYVNFRLAYGYALVCFGIELWNKIMERTNYEQLKINIDELISNIKGRLSSENVLVVDEEFRHILTRLSDAILYNVLPYADQSMRKDFIETIKKHRIENPIIYDKSEGRKYTGIYYLIDSELYSYIFSRENSISPKAMNKFKEEIYNKLINYQIATEDEVMYIPTGSGKVRIVGNNYEDYYKSPLLINEEVFKRFREGEHAPTYVEIPYAYLSIYSLQSYCEHCGKRFMNKDSIVLAINKPYHRDCFINNIESIVEKVKEEYGLKDKTNDEIKKYIKEKTIEYLSKLKDEKRPENKEEIKQAQENEKEEKEPEIKEEFKEIIEPEIKKEEYSSVNDVFQGLKEINPDQENGTNSN